MSAPHSSENMKEPGEAVEPDPSLPSSSDNRSDFTTRTKSTARLTSPDWIRTAADRVQSVTASFVQTGEKALKAPGKYMKIMVKGRRRQSVNPVSLAAANAQAQTHRMAREDAAAGEAPGDGESDRRQVVLEGGHPNPGFAGNTVITAKYNALTFLPIFLYEMFSRVAYLYFLLQASLSWIRIISPFGGWGATLALLFVLVVGGITALWQDHKRHVEDRKTNSSIAHILREDGSIQDIFWRDVQVGHLLLVRDGELFPADIMCLYSDLPDNVCFIKTTNLDGETNLKIRKPVDMRGTSFTSHGDVVKLRGTLSVEPPSANLHHLKATFSYTSGSSEIKRCPVTMNEMLLRGCMLKNSRQVVGVVVYTGKESRIQMNAARTPLKVGSFDRFLNVQIVLVMLMQLSMCVWGATANLIWRSNTGDLRYYLAFEDYVQGNYESVFVRWFLQFLTFWILYSYLVPISLFVTLEIVKFWQGFVFINNDKEMRDPASKEWAKARSANLNEDLGKVEYVFSDKTGTLTSNEMQLRMIAIKGVAYGNVKWKVEEHKEITGDAALVKFDQRLYEAVQQMSRNRDRLMSALHAGGSSSQVMQLAKSKGNPEELGLEDSAHDIGTGSDDFDNAPRTLHDKATGVLLGHHALDFWTNICVCHSLIVEPDTTEGLPVYQGPSPDEVALLDAARQLGFEFVNRSISDITIRMRGVEVKHEILNVMEFTSERGLMSVIAKAPDGTIRLYCKGADAKVMGRLRKDTDQELLDETNRNLHLFSTQGLRTLLLGTKVVSEEAFVDWDERYQDAANDIDHREERLAALANEVEADLELIGVTAIEDKLQDGVPEAIHALLNAGIRVWMITGDKQETAINIGISCKLIRKPDSLLICNGASYTEAKARLDELEDQILGMEAEGKKYSGVPVVGELVIDGKTLSFVLNSDLEEKLSEVGAKCGSVVICRASPSQKAAIVKLMMEYEMKKAAGSSSHFVRWWRRHTRRLQGKMLSIGDGANDVAMIQVADIGVGIMGKEGRQAVNNSDYAIGQFRFLVRLLLVHGTLSHYRLARLIKYSFYKNIVFAFVLFFFQFFCGYAGTTLIDGIPAAVYNVIFTSMPVLLFALLDRPVKHLTTLMRYPQIYNKASSLTTVGFWRAGVLTAIVDAVFVFFIPYYAMRVDGQHTVTDVFSLGKVVYVGLLGVITLEMVLVARFWTWLFLVFVLLSYLLCYAFFALYSYMQLWWSIYDPKWAGQPFEVMISGYFWFCLLSMYAATFGLRYFQRVWIWLFQPQDSMILSEKEAMGGPMGGDLGWQTEQRMSSLVRHSGQATGSITNGTSPNQQQWGEDYDSSDEEMKVQTVEVRSALSDVTPSEAGSSHPMLGKLMTNMSADV